MLRFLKTDLRWTLLISVLVAFGAWVAGPARYAVWIRMTCRRGGRWVAAQARALLGSGGRRAGRPPESAAGPVAARRAGS